MEVAPGRELNAKHLYKVGMEMDAGFYNETNNGPVVNARELRRRIHEENPDTRFEVVLDIGCGSGNVTKDLVREFDIGHIYAADVDQDLLDLAQKEYPSNKVTYLQQDFNMDWDNLNPELKKLEGKCNLIFSNFAMNWVRNKPNLVANIGRFLAKGGKFYANILGVADPYKDLPPNEKIVHEREFLKIPTLDDQLKLWVTLMEKNGVTVDFKRINEKITTYDKEGSWPIAVSCKLLYLAKTDKVSYERAKPIIFERALRDMHKFVDPKTGRMLVDLKYQYLTIVAHK